LNHFFGFVQVDGWEVEIWIILCGFVVPTSSPKSIPRGEKQLWVTVKITVATGANHAYYEGDKYQTA
jgi:hypothetical protein